MNNTPIRIGGVHEHFNLPIHLAYERGEFLKRGVNLQWTDFLGGTGQMCQALRNDETDLCILLTEGIIKDIIHGNPCKIISEYVITPLTWGIHTGTKNGLNHYEDIFDKKYAISRTGSGSHLMPIVDANIKGYELKADQFVKINDINGAVESLSNLESDVFYWEKFTTKPYVDSGIFRRIGEFLTPWPCFVIAASDKILKERKDDVIRVLRVIHDTCDMFMNRKEDIIPMVVQRYGQKIEDVERWYHSTEWAIHGWVSDKMIESIIFYLRKANIISEKDSIPELIWKRD